MTNVQDTSIEAFRKTFPKRGGRLVEMFEKYRFLGSHGATDHEMAELLSIPLQSVTGLRNSLIDADFVTKSKIRRKTPNDCWAHVWIINEGDNNVL